MATEGLIVGETAMGGDPIAIFETWLKAAEASEINDPNALSLATVDETGLPDVRMVLLKQVDARGFTFYTNYESAKGREILASRKAAMGFHWKSLRRQVRVRGPVETVGGEEADTYFASRARQSRLGAAASDQSRPLESRSVLEARVANLAERYEGEEVPRPPHWSGFRVVPLQIEFWADGEYRLHDRALYRRSSAAADWTVERLYP